MHGEQRSHAFVSGRSRWQLKDATVDRKEVDPAVIPGEATMVGRV